MINKLETHIFSYIKINEYACIVALLLCENLL